MSVPHARYSAGAIVFHWAIALLILANLPIGLAMGADGLDKNLGFTLFQVHKTLGIGVLLLTVGRSVWRWMNPPPALPDTMKPWERALSRAVHVLFYGAMIAMPLLGWMMVSASPTGIPTLLFGVVNWPHIGPLGALPVPTQRGAYALLEQGHEWLAWIIMALLALHVGGALKHQFLDRQQALARMVPGLFGRLPDPASPAKGGLIAMGAIAALFALGAAIGLRGGPVNDADLGSPMRNTPMVPVVAGDWIVDAAASRIAFEGRHGERTFRGQFDRWSARISFDPDELAKANVWVSIATSSAVTGDSYYDSTLLSADWFDTANHPAATFVSSAFRQTGAETYEVDGNLTIRGVSRPVTFPFELRSDGRQAEMTAALSINRLDFGVGQVADPEAEWVSDSIAVSMVVTANRKTE